MSAISEFESAGEIFLDLRYQSSSLYASSPDYAFEEILFGTFGSTGAADADTSFSMGGLEGRDSSNEVDAEKILAFNSVDNPELQLSIESALPFVPTFFFSGSGDFSVGSFRDRNLTFFANEDIVASDGSDLGVFFDGSDVGLRAFAISAFDVISDTEILMSFNRPVTIGGMRFDDSDIVKFTATSLGVNTAGTFELWFDGSDVFLEQFTEGIDALSLLRDGSFLFSIAGDGAQGPAPIRDDQLLRFVPRSLGADTLGTTTNVIDAGALNDERIILSIFRREGGVDPEVNNIDAVSTFNGDIILSTLGTPTIPTPFTASGEDTFIASPSKLFFDGSEIGFNGQLTGFDVVETAL